MSTPEIDREQQIHEEFLEQWLDGAFRYLDARYPELPWSDATPEPVWQAVHMTSPACSAHHVTPAGGENLSGITIEDNQDPDCFSIRSDNHDGSEDLIHFCDWPALRAAIDKHQSERGG